MRSSHVKTLSALVVAGATAVLVSACGTQEIQVPSGTPLHQGAVLFQARCSGCHTFAAAASNGSAANVRTSLRNNGPNFNVRKETYQRALYAIQNGGFSGAVMPQNIVTGVDAKLVAAFVAKYAGADVHTPPSPTIGGSGNGAAVAAGAVAAGAAAGAKSSTAATTAAAKPDLAAMGATVFAENGCGACHQISGVAGAVGKVGPTLNGVGGDPAAAIKTSIVKPNAEIVKGYAANIMPQNFAKLLTAQQIDALVAYLQKVAR